MKLFLNISNYIVMSLIIFHDQSYPFTYHRPLPEEIVLSDITKSQDLYSFTISVHIHAPLFKMNEKNTPIPYLIEDFNVSLDGLTYKFTLKDMLFHDKEKLNSEIVLKNIEYYLLNKVQTYENLFSIVGAEEFSNGNISKIKGIILSKFNPFSFIIKLKYPDYNLIYKLADQRLSILRPNRDPKIGLGEYKVESIKNDEIVLSKFEGNTQPEFNNSTEKVIYYLNVNKEKAISGFIKKKYDDLSFYELSKEEREKVKPYAQFVYLYSPRVYTLILQANIPKFPDKLTTEYNKVHSY